MRSPARGLLLGLAVTLAAVIAYSAYIAGQMRGLREIQSGTIDRNRRNSLQLLRIQNDLHLIGIAMRDMLDQVEPYPLTAWTAQFARIRADLEDALAVEENLAPARGSSGQRQYLATSLQQFWDALDRMFTQARQGDERGAREQIRITLQARQAALATAVARLLIENNEREEQAVQEIAAIYDRVERQVYLFLAATLIAIVVTSFYLINANRRLFARLEALSAQRAELAQKLIATQEATLRSISRELHDEFGQILTAIGAMLGRLGRRAGAVEPALSAEIEEVREIAQSALDKVRGLSQALHPVMLDEAGLEPAIDWYLPLVERRTGIVIRYERSGEPARAGSPAAIHIYRVLQEALNNVARHARTQQAWVRLQVNRDALLLEVEDHGAGFDPRSARGGIGLVAMRERAGLVSGTIEFLRPEQGGTLVRLTVPREALETDE